MKFKCGNDEMRKKIETYCWSCGRNKQYALKLCWGCITIKDRDHYNLCKRIKNFLEKKGPNMTDIKLKLKTPSVPNYILFEMPIGQRQDGFQENPKVRVGDLTDEQLEEIAEEWKHALFKKAKEQRENI